jgi:hypothetical protein
MSEVSKVAENPIMKMVIGIAQALLIAIAIGSYRDISGSLEIIKTTINTFSTSLALMSQDVEGLKRSRDIQQTINETQRTEIQRQGYEITRLSSVPPLAPPKR